MDRRLPVCTDTPGCADSRWNKRPRSTWIPPRTGHARLPPRGLRQGTGGCARSSSWMLLENVVCLAEDVSCGDESPNSAIGAVVAVVTYEKVDAIGYPGWQPVLR